MCLLKVLFNLNLVLCRETEKIAIPPKKKTYEENHLYVMFYTKKKGKKSLC